MTETKQEQKKFNTRIGSDRFSRHDDAIHANSMDEIAQYSEHVAREHNAFSWELQKRSEYFATNQLVFITSERKMVTPPILVDEHYSHKELAAVIDLGWEKAKRDK